MTCDTSHRASYTATPGTHREPSDGGDLLGAAWANLSVQVYNGTEPGRGEGEGERITVDLYYEVLCPDSRQFLLYQLYPAWQTMASIFTVNFIPYGKAFVSRQ